MTYKVWMGQKQYIFLQPCPILCIQQTIV